MRQALKSERRLKDEQVSLIAVQIRLKTVPNQSSHRNLEVHSSGSQAWHFRVQMLAVLRLVNVLQDVSETGLRLLSRSKKFKV